MKKVHFFMKKFQRTLIFPLSFTNIMQIWDITKGFVKKVKEKVDKESFIKEINKRK